MARWLAAAGSMLCASIGHAQSPVGPLTAVVTGDKPFVCLSRPHYEGLWGFEKDGLVEALGKGLAMAAITRACVMLEPGETVTVLAGDPRSDFTQVRRQGADQPWWIARQRLK